VELWNDVVTKDGKPSPKGVFDSIIPSSFNTGEFAVVTGGFQFMYTDPLNPEAPKLTLDGGSLIGVQTETFIQTAKGRFYYVGKSPQGVGWLPDGTFELATINSLWKLGCPPCSYGNNAQSQPC
jgi:hypothetical protein